MKRYVIIVVLLLIVAAFSLNHLFFAGGRERPVDLAQVISNRIDAWEGEELKLSEGTLKLLGTNNVLLRMYEDVSAQHAPVCLCLTFTWGNHRVTHPPEICYEGQGWEIPLMEEIDFTFQAETPVTRRVNRMQIFKNGEVQEVVVWYRTASSDTSSYIHQKLEMLLSSLIGSARWSAMIRLSCRVEPSAPKGALESIAAFGGALLPHLEDLARKVETE